MTPDLLREIRQTIQIEPVGTRLPNQEVVTIMAGTSTREVERFAHAKNPDWAQTRQSSDGFSVNWHGEDGETLDKCIDLMKYGWPKGTKQARDLASQITGAIPPAAARKKLYRPSFTPRGALIPNIGGHGPCHFIGVTLSEELQKGRRIIRLLYNGGASAAVDADTLRSRGAAVMALVEILRLLRYDTEIMWVFISQAGDRTVVNQWRIKAPGESINMDQLAFGLVHPCALRRIGFSMLEHLPGNCARFYGGYGHPTPIETLPHLAKNYDIVMDSDSIDGPKGMGPWTDPAASIGWIQEQLRKLGVKLSVKFNAGGDDDVNAGE